MKKKIFRKAIGKGKMSFTILIVLACFGFSCVLLFSMNDLLVYYGIVMMLMAVCAKFTAMLFSKNFGKNNPKDYKPVDWFSLPHFFIPVESVIVMFLIFTRKCGFDVITSAFISVLVTAFIAVFIEILEHFISRNKQYRNYANESIGNRITDLVLAAGGISLALFLIYTTL